MTVCVEYPPGSVKKGSCVKCGKTECCKGQGMPRDVEYERYLSYVARQAGELPVPVLEDHQFPPTSLAAFAESRTRPGNVLTDGRDMMVEASEEFADAANYLRWRCQQLQEGFDAGESVACREYAMAMRALMYAELAYEALTVPPQ